MDRPQPLVPRIHCINLRLSTARHDRMVQRFAIHNLTDRVSFIPAVPADSALVDYYASGADCWYGDTQHYTGMRQWRKDLACLASHLLALRLGLSELGPADEGFLVCEDDILLHDRFAERWHDLKSNTPKGTPLVQLAFMLDEAPTAARAGVDSSRGDLAPIDPIHTWGGHLYWISRDYAQEALNRLDRPPVARITAEEIIRTSRGLRAAVPLAVEDLIDSDRAPQDLPFHAMHFAHWRYSNYAKCDPDRLSPLRNCKEYWPLYDQVRPAPGVAEGTKERVCILV